MSNWVSQRLKEYAHCIPIEVALTHVSRYKVCNLRPSDSVSIATLERSQVLERACARGKGGEIGVSVSGSARMRYWREADPDVLFETDEACTDKCRSKCSDVSARASMWDCGTHHCAACGRLTPNKTNLTSPRPRHVPNRKPVLAGPVERVVGRHVSRH